MSRYAAFLASVPLALLFVQCRVDQRIAYEGPETPPELITPSTVAEAGTVLYCPSNKCPDGFTTCPTSPFACDVNLKNDRNNCGACGVVCPTPPRPPGGIFTDPHEAAISFACVDGRCVLACANAFAMDCDGLVDNGCETLPSDSNHCGACGNACLDPAKPCTRQPDQSWACGCPDGTTLCGAQELGCVSIEGNDYNCGACFNVCNPNGSGDASAPPPNAYYGCAGTECGHLKCADGFGNCDGNTANGCESPLQTNENCGFCGNACPSGESCLFDKQMARYRCLCAPGLTYCNGECVDLASDSANCGVCGNMCARSGTLAYVGTCSLGECEWSCVAGTADCNGNSDDECEVNTMNDPQNCGGCGIVCDGIAGQACSGGRCVVEPCDQDGGVTAR